MMAPGVVSRPHNDGSGRQNYFGNAVEHRDAVTLMEGLYAGNYNDFNINRTGLSSEAIEDTEIKTGGVDAASPMGYGLVINMISKSGGNQFRGSGSTQYQPIDWNANNVGQGTPATRQVYQYDFSLGGPVKRDRTWFFAALRFTDNKSGTGRTPELVAIHRAIIPNGTLGDNSIRGFQPWVKVTTKAAANHDLSFVYQADRLLLKVVGAEDYEPVEVLSTGGPMYGMKLTSVWGPRVTSTLSASYNRKGGNSLDSYKGRNLNGPLTEYHREAFLNQGILQGSGLLVQRRTMEVHGLRRLLRPRYLVHPDAARRPDLVRARLGRHARRPDGVPRTAGEQLRQERSVSERRVHLRRAATDQSQRSVGWDRAVPSAICDRQPRPAHGVGARPRYRRVRPGYVEADIALDGDDRDSVSTSSAATTRCGISSGRTAPRLPLVSASRTC